MAQTSSHMKLFNGIKELSGSYYLSFNMKELFEIRGAGPSSEVIGGVLVHAATAAPAVLGSVFPPGAIDGVQC